MPDTKIITLSGKVRKSGVAEIRFGDIWWDQVFDPESGMYSFESNTRVDSFENPLSDAEGKPTSKGLCIPLSAGWDSTQGTIPVEPLPEKEGLRAVKQRQEQVAKMPEAYRAAYLEQWTDSKGAWIRPRYKALAGFRRGLAFPVARNYTAGKLEQGTPKDAITVRIYDGLTDLERLTLHTRENTFKTKGASRYSETDLLLVAKRILQSGGKESDLVKAGVKRGMAQKLWAVVRLDSRFPNIHLVDRCMMPISEDWTYTDDGPIPVSKLDKETVRVWASGKPKEGIPPLDDAQEFASKLETLVANGQKVSRSFDRKTMETYAEGHPTYIVRLVVHACMKGDKETMAEIGKYAELLNGISTGDDGLKALIGKVVKL